MSPLWPTANPDDFPPGFLVGRAMSIGLFALLSEALKNPRNIATVAPSSAALAEAMVDAIPRPLSRVVEIGPGTGPITARILDSGLPPSSLLTVEANATLGRGLIERFPSVHTSIADARNLSTVLVDAGWPPRVPVIVSSLGLRSMPSALVEEILRAVDECLLPSGVFVQFTYRLHSSVPSDLRRQLGWSHERTEVVWRNLPPASVHRYTKR